MPPVTKPPGRQTNNSLSSIPESLLLASCASNNKASSGGGGAGAGKNKKASGKSVNSKKEKEKEKVSEGGGAGGGKSGSNGSSSNSKSTGGEKAAKNKTSTVRDGGAASSSSSGSAGATKSAAGDEKEPNPAATAAAAVAAAARKKKEKSQVFTPTLIPTLSFTETDEVLQIGMHKVLEYVKNHKDAWPFMDPVEEDIAPRYYSIIRRPMDLLKMEEKLDNEEYLRYSDFRNDFKLIVNNCRLYNGHNNEYTEMVNNLQEAFDKATKKYFEQNSSDEEEMNQEYPDLSLKTSAFREKPSGPASLPAPGSNNKGMLSPKRKESSSSGGGGGTANKTKSHKSTTSSGDGKEVVVAKKKKTLDVPKRSDSTAKTICASDDEEEEVPSESVSITNKVKNEKQKGSKTSVAVGRKKKDNNNSSNRDAGDLSLRETGDNNNSSSAKKTNKHNKKIGGSVSSKKLIEDRVKADKEDEDVEKEAEDDEDVAESTAVDEEPSRVKGVKRKRKDKDKKRKKKKHETPAENESAPEEYPAKGDESEEEQVISKKHKNKKASSESHKKGKDKSTKKVKHKDQLAGSKGKVEKHHHHHHHHHRKDEDEEEEEEEEMAPAEESPAKKGKTSTSKSKSTNVASSHSKGKHKSKSKVAEGYVDEYSFTDGEPDLEMVPSPAKKQKKSQGEDQKLGKSKAKHGVTGNKSKGSKKGGAAVEEEVPPKKKDKNKVSGALSSKKSNKSASKLSETKASAKKAKKHGAAAKPVDRMSVSSHDADDDNGARLDRLSHSSNPIGSPVFDRSRDLDDTFDSLHSGDNRALSRPITPDIKDKYDLIKQRRRNAGKSSATDSPRPNSVDVTKKEKVKKSSSKSGVHEDERDESSDREEGGADTASVLFDRLREEDLKSTSKRDTPTEKDGDEYEFVDENAKAKGGAKAKANSTNDSGKEKAKKGQMKEPPAKLPKGAAVPKKTNLEALELETEQTLKDINRWLEHTPRFPDYSSASNSPSRYMLEEFDTVDPNVFRRPGAVAASPSTKTPPMKSSGGDDPKRAKEHSANRLGPGPATNGPGAVRRDVIKDKRKSLKDKIYNRKKEPSRTIDRLQPGKAKGNLLNSIQNINKPDELFALGGNLAKLKEVKNSLVVKEDESGPKLSLGSVLDTDRFGLLQQHNFTEDKENDDKLMAEDVKSPLAVPTDSLVTSEVAKVAVDQQPQPKTEAEAPAASDSKDDKSSATPNHSAWFKAFGAPKVTKPDDESRKSDDKMDMKSPTQRDGESYYMPAGPRMRKASTGSTISERSSYSQDPDSPRVGMDERLGYAANQYTSSPLDSSPTSLTSPKPDDMSKSNYNLNGAIKVGFYQDTTQKSSPEKSCSPREMPTPTYPQYSQPVYSATHAYANYYNTTSPVAATGNGANGGGAPSNGTGTANTTAAVSENNNKAAAPAVNPPFYDHYNKQPRSQESDYNSSMSPNPNSPYQQQHHSPYHQQQHSPYQQHHSPAAAAASVQSSVSAPQSHQSIQPASPYSQSNQSSPFSQQDPNSPYPRTDQMSPYNHPNSPSQVPATAAVTQNAQQQQHSQAANKSSHEGWLPAGNPTTTPAAIQTAIPMQSSIPQAHNSSKVSPAQTTSSSAAAPPQSAAVSQHHTSSGQQQQQQQQQQQHAQYGQMDGQQNITPAHQNYSMFPSSLSAAHSKSYDDPQSLLMSHHNLHSPHHAHSAAHHHHQQSVYSAPNEVPAHSKTDASTASQQQQQQHQQQMYDFMNLRKASFGNISTSKAFEMFNRAATMAFPKSLSQTTSSSSASSSSAMGAAGEPKDVYNMDYSKAAASAVAGYGNTTFDMLKGGPSQPELLNLGHSKSVSAESQQSQQQQSQHVQSHNQTTAHNAHQATTAAQSAQQQHHQYGAASRSRATDLVIPNPRAGDQHKAANVDPMHHQQQHAAAAVAAAAAQQRYDYGAMSQISSYRSSPFGAAGQQHLSSMGLDERLMGMPQHAAGGYYDKSSLSQNMFGAKPGGMPYGGGYDNKTLSDQHQQHVAGHHAGSGGTTSGGAAQPASIAAAPAKKKGGGRGKKSKTATPPTEPAAHAGNVAHNSAYLQANQQGQLQAHGHQMGQASGYGHHAQEAAAAAAHHAAQQQSQQQGFQSYSNLKTAIAAASTTVAGASSNSAADGTAISLKTASMMPASAFNFGPTSTGPLGLYGETSSYLDDFRNPANHYYLPPSAQVTDKGSGNSTGAGGANASTGSSGNAGTGGSSSAAAVQSAYHQFLSHQQTRPTYPFMNSQLDPNSPIYQQFFQRRQDEIRAQMMLNQGLLGPHPGAPPGAYGQPGYHHPSLGMHKPPYDTMNRPSWL